MDSLLTDSLKKKEKRKKNRKRNQRTPTMACVPLPESAHSYYRNTTNVISNQTSSSCISVFIESGPYGHFYGISICIFMVYHK